MRSRPALRTSWVGAALANSLAGNYARAFDLVTKANVALSEEPASAYEASEFLLFQNQCLEKDGKYQEALAHLKAIECDVVDTLGLKVKEAEMLLLSGKFEEAQAAWLKLAADQNDNYRFHCGLQTAYLCLDAARAKEMLALKRLDLPSTRLALSAEQRAVLLELYTKSGKIKCPRKIEFTLQPSLHGPEFRALLDAHIRKCLTSGVPALYHDICSLVTARDPLDPAALVLVKDAADFRAHAVTQVASEIVAGLISNLRAHDSFDGPLPAGAAPEPPTSLLWALYLQTHLLERSGNLELALANIDECIAHTPTAPDMLLKKARLLKLCGDAAAAAAVCDEGRALDLQDRYLNNKATKYFMRADQVAEGLATISMFTKHEGDPQQYLAEMQCSWFELEAGEALCRTKNWGPALKKFHSVRKHFQDYVEDMFDFHGFCVRKMSLRAHADSIEMQDAVYAHKTYQRACRGALRVFLHLLDEPEDLDGLGHLGKEERKKERAKRKKIKQRDLKAAEDRRLAAEEERKWSGANSRSAPLDKDDDPFGEKYLTLGEGKTRNFLEDAAAWAASLSTRLGSCDGDTLALVAEVHTRRGKLVQAAKALSAGLRRFPSHPALATALVKTAQRVPGLGAAGGAAPLGPKDLKETTKAVVAEEVARLLGGPGKGLAAFVDDVVARATHADSGSLPLRVGAARCLLALHGCRECGPGQGAAEAADKLAAREAAAALLTGDAPWAGRGVTFVNAREALKVSCDQLNLQSPGSRLLALAAAIHLSPH